MRKAIFVVMIGMLQWGCNPPPPPRVPVPSVTTRAALREYDREKPLPDQSAYEDMRLQPAYDDAPLVIQRPPEQRAFVETYRRVGQPRIAVFVNRTLDGNLVPVAVNDPVVSADLTRRATTGVSVEQRSAAGYGGYYGGAHRDTTDRFETKGPGEYRESVAVYLKPGQYDEVQAKSLDYEAMENILTDWIACNGQVMVMSPLLVRQRLTDQQVQELQSGRPQVLRELAQQLDADILIQVQSHPTKQTREGLQVRVIAEAMNVKGGQSIGRAVVDVPPPLEKTQINRYTRFLARKLMDDMTQAWVMPLPAPTPEAAPAPTPAPVPAPLPVPAPAPALPRPLPPATQP